MRKNDSLKSVRLTSEQLEWLQSDALPYTGSVSQRIRFALLFMEEILASMPTEILEFVMSERSLHEKTTLTSLYAQYSAVRMETAQIRNTHYDLKENLDQIEEDASHYITIMKPYRNRIPTDEERKKLFGIRSSDIP